MTDTHSEAARSLAKARWKTAVVDRLVHELAERRDELGQSQRDELRAVLDGPTTETHEEIS